MAPPPFVWRSFYIKLLITSLCEATEMIWQMLWGKWAGMCTAQDRLMGKWSSGVWMRQTQGVVRGRWRLADSEMAGLSVNRNLASYVDEFWLPETTETGVTVTRLLWMNSCSLPTTEFHQKCTMFWIILQTSRRGWKYRLPDRNWIAIWMWNNWISNFGRALFVRVSIKVLLWYSMPMMCLRLPLSS